MFGGETGIYMGPRVKPEGDSLGVASNPFPHPNPFILKP